jgi:hypothetical protein
MASEADARQKHPAGKQWVPKVEILERLLQLVDGHHWMYGAVSDEAPSRIERWDTRTLLDYACMAYGETGHFRPSFTTFYLWRSNVMQLLMNSHGAVCNYGDWRYWETEKDRTYMDIQSVVQTALRIARTEAQNK